MVPHNLYLMMYSPASVNVLPFDPLQGADAARAYATKYCRSVVRFLCFVPYPRRPSRDPDTKQQKTTNILFF